MLGTATSMLGCGYVLYPERRGNHSGTVDGGTLVMDCLWLLAGIVPGVVFLIVDFSSGAMYVGGRGSIHIADNGKVKLDVNDVKDAKTLRFRVIDSNNRLVDSRDVAVGPAIHHQSVELDVASAARDRQHPLKIEISDAAAPTTLLQSLSMI